MDIKKFLRNIKVVRTYRSPYQTITLARLKGKRVLFLNGELQYIEGQPLEEYHSALAGGLDYVPHARKVAIIGGGDGILAYYLIKRKPDLKVYMFELDKKMIDVYSRDPEARAVNGDVYNRYRKNLKIIIGDASKTLRRHRGFDAVFQDLPDMYSVGEDLYLNMMDVSYNALNPYGVYAMYSGGYTSPPPKFYRRFRLAGRRFVDIPEFGLGALIFYGRKV